MSEPTLCNRLKFTRWFARFLVGALTAKISDLLSATVAFTLTK